MIKVFVRSERLLHTSRKDGRQWPYQEIDVVYPGERNAISDRIFLDHDEAPFPVDSELMLDLQRAFYPGRFNRLSFKPRFVVRQARDETTKPAAVK